jgi:hypothetical protein
VILRAVRASVARAAFFYLPFSICDSQWGGACRQVCEMALREWVEGHLDHHNRDEVGGAMPGCFMNTP